MTSIHFHQATEQRVRHARWRHLPIAVAAALLGGAACYLPPAGADDMPKPAVSGMGVKVAPGDDFARYVNGEWEERTVIPADRGIWGTFEQMTEDNWGKMAALYQEAA